MPELTADVICRILGFKLQDLIFFHANPNKKNQKGNPQQGCTG
jgi:hypothetical protein